MTDIVERLREHAATSSYLTECRPRGLVCKAADEIERLRAEVHILSTSCGHCGDLERAWQETERLRAALRAIETACADHASRASIAMIARAALGENSHE